MRIVTFLVIGTMAFVAGAAVFLLSTDVNRYRGEIAAEAKDATGRELDIAGTLSLKLTPHPTLIAENVTLANAPWGSQPVMADIGRAEAAVRLWPLFAGELEITRLALIDAKILLETDEQGRRNWVFADEANETETDGGASAAVAADEAVVPRINDVRVEDAFITYRDGATGRVLQVMLAHATAAAPAPDQPIDLALDGVWSGHPVSLAGRVGPLPPGTRTGRAVPVALTAGAFGLEAGAEGTMIPGSAPAFDLALAIAGDDLSGLAVLSGDPPRIRGPLRIAGHLTGDAGTATLDDMILTLGANTLAGSVVYTDCASRPLIEATLKAGDSISAPGSRRPNPRCPAARQRDKARLPAGRSCSRPSRCRSIDCTGSTRLSSCAPRNSGPRS